MEVKEAIKLATPVVDMEDMDRAIKFNQVMGTVHKVMDTVLGMAINRRNNRYIYSSTKKEKAAPNQFLNQTATQTMILTTVKLTTPNIPTLKVSTILMPMTNSITSQILLIRTTTRVALTNSTLSLDTAIIPSPSHSLSHSLNLSLSPNRNPSLSLNRNLSLNLSPKASLINMEVMVALAINKAMEVKVALAMVISKAIKAALVMEALVMEVMQAFHLMKTCLEYQLAWDKNATCSKKLSTEEYIIKVDSEKEVTVMDTDTVRDSADTDTNKFNKWNNSSPNRNHNPSHSHSLNHKHSHLVEVKNATNSYFFTLMQAEMESTLAKMTTIITIAIMTVI